MPPENFEISTPRLNLAFSIRQSRLALVHFAPAPELESWALPSSRLFQVEVDGVLVDAVTLELQDLEMEPLLQGAQSCTLRFVSPGFQLDHHLRWFEGTALLEQWQEIRSTGDAALRVSRLDSFALELPPAAYELLYFDSDWGAEFDLKRVLLEETIAIQTRAGRSSKGKHPWFALSFQDGILSASLAWSGNWISRFERLPSGTVSLSGGLNDWQFARELQPGQTLTSPKAVLVLGQDLNDLSPQYAEVGRRYWYPRSRLSSRLPVEWNHWWSYEDREIDERVFRQNLRAARRLGIELCTLDAGWFGPEDPEAHWYAYRGDWDRVNAARFPGGILALSEAAHELGMSFGLWCEIEGLGEKARLSFDHPEFAANREGQPLGYVCFGCPQVQDWAFATLDRLITAYRLDWIKLDFNLDPGAGCDRRDHGHGIGDGLFEHVRGYYRVLDRLRAAHPQVVLENCSSGGLRIDLGIMQHTHLTFLSDPDWPVHSLQVFWGASLMLAPEVCLHWSFSDWRGEGHPPQQNFDPHDPRLTPCQLDYYTRIAMLGALGFSQRLDALPDWVASRLRDHIRIYKEHVRGFVRQGTLTHLSGQPRRDGTGERWPAFQYSLPESDQHLLFIFRLPGAEPERHIPLIGLKPDRLYTLEGFDGEPPLQLSGAALLSPGLLLRDLLEEDSRLWWLHGQLR